MTVEPSPQFEDGTGGFVGQAPCECGEHRTVGEHRAWCHEDTEWCYPSMPCRGCEIARLRVQVAHQVAELLKLRAERRALWELLKRSVRVTGWRSVCPDDCGHSEHVSQTQIDACLRAASRKRRVP
jgi:hypothetical protein